MPELELDDLNRTIEQLSAKRDALNADLKRLGDARDKAEAEQAAAGLVAGLSPAQRDAIYESLTQRVSPTPIPSEETVGGF